jgi:hypothetical protein
MNPENSSESDQMLHTALREWRVRESLPPHFGDRVWQRIARAEAQAPGALWAQLLSRMANAVLRPSLAISYVTVLLVAGLAAGYLQGRADNERVSHELSSRYVQMLVPYQTPHP